MTEYEMIRAMWLIFGNFPTSRYDMLGEELYQEIYDYLHGEEDEEGDEDFDELDSDACFEDEEEEIFGGDDDT